MLASEPERKMSKATAAMRRMSAFDPKRTFTGLLCFQYYVYLMLSLNGRILAEKAWPDDARVHARGPRVFLPAKR